MDTSDEDFDALAYASELEQAGVPPQQARVHARALSTALSKHAVHPRDLMLSSRAVTAAFEKGLALLRFEQAEQNGKLRAEQAERDQKIYKEIGRLATSVAAIKWTFGTLVMATLGIAAYLINHSITG